jgi:hypothetical protein
MKNPSLTKGFNILKMGCIIYFEYIHASLAGPVTFAFIVLLHIKQLYVKLGLLNSIV